MRRLLRFYCDKLYIGRLDLWDKREILELPLIFFYVKSSNLVLE